MATPELGSAAASSGTDRVRAVTDAEATSFQENGWVKLPGLVSPAVAGRMRAWLEDRMGTRAERAGKGRPSSDRFRDMWNKYNSPSEDSELFDAFAKSPEMGRLGAALSRRTVRFWADTALIKPPGKGEAGVTPWHQDTPAQPHDRRGLLTIWLALADIPPERGTMRFLSGSHREGPLGRPFQEDPTLDYPYVLETYETSPPLHLAAGDATVHDGLVCHAAPPNSTDDVRWAYAVSLIDAKTRYTGFPPSWVADDKGIEVGQPFDHAAFPVLA